MVVEAGKVDSAEHAPVVHSTVTAAAAPSVCLSVCTERVHGEETAWRGDGMERRRHGEETAWRGEGMERRRHGEEKAWRGDGMGRRRHGEQTAWGGDGMVHGERRSVACASRWHLRLMRLERDCKGAVRTIEHGEGDREDLPY
jgi:hypothetical protein